MRQLLEDVRFGLRVFARTLATGFLRGRGGNFIAVRGRPEPSPDTATPDVARDDISVNYFKVIRPAAPSRSDRRAAAGVDSPSARA